MDPWSKVDYSRLIREASMVVEKLPVVVLPSGRVPGRVLLMLPILEALRRRNRGEIAKKGSVLEGFGTRGVYMPKGVTRSGEGGPGALPRRPGVGPPGLPLAPLWPHFWRVEASGALIFYIFFPEFFWQFK